MQKALGQPIVIANIGGAGGMIAAAKAARAEPDGYPIPCSVKMIANLLLLRSYLIAI